MLSSLWMLLAGFTAPEEIGMNPASLLWMFPLLAAISAVYKATKMRVIFWKKYFREVGILFATLSIFMVVAAAVLLVVVQLLTS